MRKLDSNLHERLEKLINSMGYEIWGYELISQGRQLIFRLYIDTPKGVTIEDCSQVSYQVSAMMDVEDPFQSRYTLEVSSPGIDRPLFELEHYHQYIGKRVNIRLHLPINRRRQFKGVLHRVEGENIYLLMDDSNEMRLPYSEIEKANVIGDVYL